MDLTAILSTSGCTLHPNRENSLFGGAILSTSGCTLHPYRENFLMDGESESDKLFSPIHFPIFFCLMESFLLSSINHTINSLIISEWMGSKFLQPIRFGVKPEVDGEFTLVKPDYR